MNDKFNLLKEYYNDGLWNIKRMRNAVIKEWISEEEFKIITGENYIN